MWTSHESLELDLPKLGNPSLHTNHSVETTILGVTERMFNPPSASLFTLHRKSFYSLHMEALHVQLHGVLVNWQFLVSADMLHYAYLLQCPLHYLPF